MIGFGKGIVLAGTLGAVVLTVTSEAVAQDCPISTGPERQQEMQRVLEELNSPNPTVSIPTFEIVMQGCDATMRRLALRTALQSDDPILQELAVSGFLSGSASIIVYLELPEDANSYAVRFMTDSGGRIEVMISGFEASTGTFGARIAGGNSDETTGRGTVIGRRISFDADASHVYSSARTCRGVLSGESESASLVGTLACDSSIEMSATINLLE